MRVVSAHVPRGVRASRTPPTASACCRRACGRCSIEAGRTPPWRSIVGEDGLTIGIDHFGASAPDKVLAEKFGLTVDAVTARIRDWR